MLDTDVPSRQHGINPLPPTPLPPLCKKKKQLSAYVSGLRNSPVFAHPRSNTKVTAHVLYDMSPFRPAEVHWHYRKTSYKTSKTPVPD